MRGFQTNIGINKEENKITNTIINEEDNEGTLHSNT